MKDEIKEILDMFTKYKDNWFSAEYILKPKQCVALYDYITNLQEELKSANESIIWWNNRFNAVEKENERLKELEK